MGKVGRTAVAVLILAAGALAPGTARGAPSPMQGHYTGPWHSDGQYHFDVPFCTGVDLQITIDGTLDLMVSADGQVSGTAAGKVDAPITDCGRHDVSSGYGTISGQVTGTLSASGSSLVLAHPVIAMQWGTFVGGGYTVSRSVTMPDYQFSGSPGDCISAQGTIQEQDFPTQWIVADGAGQMVQAPGIGVATGTWSAAGDKAGSFAAFSQRIDAFIAQANAALQADAVTPAAAMQQVVQPLQALQAAAGQDPDLSRCLLDRLNVWTASAVASLSDRAAALAGSASLPSLRRAADLLRVAAALSGTLPPASAVALQNTEMIALDRAIAAGDWSSAALLTRELLLWRGDAFRSHLQGELDAGLHARLAAASGAPAVLEIARLAYALGDDGDVAAAYSKLTTRRGFALQLRPQKHRKKKPTRKPTPRPTARPTAGPTSTPTSTPKPVPTATPKPLTVEQVLSAGVTDIHAHLNGSAIAWEPVPGAARYLVTVTAPQSPAILWSWSGSAFTVSYGDTSIDGVSGTGNDGWPSTLPAGVGWTVLALDAQGKVIGLKLR